MADATVKQNPPLAQMGMAGVAVSRGVKFLWTEETKLVTVLIGPELDATEQDMLWPFFEIILFLFVIFQL